MNTLPKSESLKSKTLIRLLFSSKKTDFVYPFKIVYLVLESKEKHPALMLISVGKKKIQNAVDRNHIKRLFREAYRKNKHPLLDILQSKNRCIALGFVYVGDKNPDYNIIEEKVILAINLLVKKFA